MRSVDQSLVDAMNSGSTTLANCWNITKRDGTILKITDLDSDIIIGPDVYKSAPGVTPTRIEESFEFRPGNLELNLLIDGVIVTKSDIISGIYDRAKIEMFVVDYNNLPSLLTRTNVIWMKTGWIGNVRIKGNVAKVEFRGLEQAFKTQIIEATSRLCRANLGDAKCTKDLTSFTWTGTIVSQSGKNIILSFSSGTNVLAQGYIELVSGPVPGARFDILSNVDKTVTLFSDPVITGLVGANIKAVAGCDKSIVTCKNVFNNVLNFQGEPHVPTRDSWVAGKKATAGSSKTTTSGGGK